MQRRALVTRWLIFAGIAAVLYVFLVFKIRVAVAGGKYLIALGIILFILWLISRARR